MSNIFLALGALSLLPPILPRALSLLPSLFLPRRSSPSAEARRSRPPPRLRRRAPPPCRAGPHHDRIHPPITGVHLTTTQPSPANPEPVAPWMSAAGLDSSALPLVSTPRRPREKQAGCRCHRICASLLHGTGSARL
ncbi:hypothetical protein PVAP13_1NG059844 [Panicum virgatum]|uniref:Uncharacterized protein n=1 Tax=Panicum virgatum TaxID=38727 RepID=A0A8T0WWB2_PANVG|nr:hypothetical protein PVAP13_1NG059844 [Panicum virgatum]